jgi:hypothetical protein
MESSSYGCEMEAGSYINCMERSSILLRPEGVNSICGKGVKSIDNLQQRSTFFVQFYLVSGSRRCVIRL